MSPSRTALVLTLSPLAASLAGWVIADAAAPGATQVTNALTDAARSSQPPGP